MSLTLISKKASNWVDRGEPAWPTLRRILAHHFDRHAEADHAWLDEHAAVVYGMVADELAAFERERRDDADQDRQRGEPG